MFSTWLYASCFIAKDSFGQSDPLFKELNFLFLVWNFNRLLVTFQLLSIKMTIISPERKKARADELFKAHFIKMIERCICIQLWKKDRVAKQLLCRLLCETSHSCLELFDASHDNMQHWAKSMILVSTQTIISKISFESIISFQWCSFSGLCKLSQLC